MSQPPFDCPVCEKTLSDSRFVTKETSPRGHVEIRQCRHCQLHFTWPRLIEPQQQYHEAISKQKWEKRYAKSDRGELIHDRHPNYLEVTRKIERYLDSGRILDVGCHVGWFLQYLQQTDRYVSEGVEPSPVLAEVAQHRLGLTIHNCYLHQLSDRAEFYDGVVANDVFEHVLPEDINQFLHALFAVLKPGGLCFIKTPNAQFTALKSAIIYALPARVRKFMVRGSDVWDAKEHVVHWDVANMIRIFEKHRLLPVETSTPRPVETRNSPFFAMFSRKMLYKSAMFMGGDSKVLPFSQDILLIARKKS